MSNNDIYNVTPEIKNMLEQLSVMPESEIDLSDPDAPEVTNWDDAVHGKFYRPVKQLISIRIDKDVLHWFKSSEKKYQKLINKVCRQYMESSKKA